MHYTKPKLIQLIHIAKAQLKMDELSYRCLLQQVAQKESCKQMKVTELMAVLHAMESKGFRARSGKMAGRGKSPRSQDAKVRHSVSLKIRALWIEMFKNGIVRDGSEDALNAFVRKVINQKSAKTLVLNVASLSYEQGAMVLERLKKWRKRTALSVKNGGK